MEAEEANPFFQRPLIVVADDDHAMRQVLWTRLTRLGYRVRLAADGAEAIERVRNCVALGPRTKPAAVVTDLRMPGMGGLELLVRLRHLHPELPVVVTTAFGDPETHDELRRLGAAATFDKPLVVADLVAALQRIAPNDAGGWS